MPERVKVVGKRPSKSSWRSAVHVDHVTPVVDPQEGAKRLPDGRYDLNDYVYNRLFCDVSNLQVLCLTCHAAKTRIENEERKRCRDRTT